MLVKYSINFKKTNGTKIDIKDNIIDFYHALNFINKMIREHKKHIKKYTLSDFTLCSDTHRIIYLFPKNFNTDKYV
jgi:hypothetical protein